MHCVGQTLAVPGTAIMVMARHPPPRLRGSAHGLCCCCQHMVHVLDCRPLAVVPLSYKPWPWVGACCHNVTGSRVTCCPVVVSNRPSLTVWCASSTCNNLQQGPCFAAVPGRQLYPELLMLPKASSIQVSAGCLIQK